MGWFKWKKLVDGSVDASNDVLAERIAERILVVQRKVANELNSSVRGMRKQRLVAWLLGVGICFGRYCLWLVLGVFR